MDDDDDGGDDNNIIARDLRTSARYNRFPKDEKRVIVMTCGHDSVAYARDDVVVKFRIDTRIYTYHIVCITRGRVGISRA